MPEQHAQNWKILDKRCGMWPDPPPKKRRKKSFIERLTAFFSCNAQAASEADLQESRSWRCHLVSNQANASVRDIHLKTGLRRYIDTHSVCHTFGRLPIVVGTVSYSLCRGHRQACVRGLVCSLSSLKFYARNYQADQKRRSQSAAFYTTNKNDLLACSVCYGQ